MNLYPPSVVIPIYAVFTGVGLVLTGLRFWVRVGYAKGRLGIDDLCIGIGMLIVCACTGIQFYNSLKGTGGDASSAADDEAAAIVAKKVDFTMVVIEKPAFGAIKLSLLFFYKRVFGIWPSFKRANLVLIIIIILWAASFVIADLSICGNHLEYCFMLDQTLAKENCGDKGLVLLVFAITSVLTDVFVLGLPFFYINKLQMPPEKKFATTIVILLGFISTAAGVLRTIFLSISYPMGRMDWGFTPPPDQEEPLVLKVFNPTFWVMIEMLLGSWAANLPPLGPLLGAMGFREVVNGAYRKLSSAYASIASSEKTGSIPSSTSDVHRNSDDALMPHSSLNRTRTSYV